MFEQVNLDSLQTGVKYKIMVYHYAFTGIFMNGYYFKHVRFGDRYLGTLQFHDTDRFYKWVSIKERVQQEMEHRAVNQLLQNIICDEHFRY